MSNNIAPTFALHVDALGGYYLDGPAAYMDAQGITLMHAILDHSDVLLDQLLLKYRQEDWQQVVLRRFQLDYAAWMGIVEMTASVTQSMQPALFAQAGGTHHAYLRLARPKVVPTSPWSVAHIA